MSETPSRRHLLLVAWGFPPCRAGGVYRALALANSFATDGWDVTVLTAEREVFVRYTGIDASLEDRIDPSVNVVRIPFRWTAKETNIRNYSLARVYAPVRMRKIKTGLDNLAFPEVSYATWRHELERAAARIHAEHPVDLTLATANPHVAFTAAYYLHRKFGVPYVMDYRDAWTLNVFTGAEMHPPSDRAGRWERRLVTAAHEIWFVNEPIRAWHAKRYPEAADRMHVVANGFDPELRAVVHMQPAADAATFGYLGTITRALPLDEFVTGWRLARAGRPQMAHAQAHLHGYVDYYLIPGNALAAALKEAETDEVRYLGPVARTETDAVYQGFDALLLILGTGRYVTSGKVFEYLATGLPIVSVHDPGNAASDVLRGYPLWFPAKSLNPTAIADALADAAEAVTTASADTRAAALAFSEKFSRRHQLDPRIAALGELVSAATSGQRARA